MSIDDDLERVSALREQQRTARVEATERLKRLVEADMQDYEDRLNAACSVARESGASLAAIGRALGTKDYGTVKRRLANAPTDVQFVNVATDNGPAEFDYSPPDGIGDAYLIYKGNLVEFIQYEDTGDVEFFGIVPEDQAIKYLKSVGAIR